MSEVYLNVIGIAVSSVSKFYLNVIGIAVSFENQTIDIVFYNLMNVFKNADHIQ